MTIAAAAASAWLDNRAVVRAYTSANFIDIGPCACSVRRIQTLRGLESF